MIRQNTSRRGQPAENTRPICSENVPCPVMTVRQTSRTGLCAPADAGHFPPPRPTPEHLASLEGPRRAKQWARASTIYDRLYRKVDPNGPEMRPGLGRCHVWTGYRLGVAQMHGGIGWHVRFGNTPAYTHRVAWELAYGVIPDGRQVNHHCDNGLCVRLDHLYLGTQLDNMRDASRRGRFHVPRTTRVLTPDEREAIYALPARRGLVRDLAAQYGVSESCIWLIRKGRFVRLGRTA